MRASNLATVPLPPRRFTLTEQAVFLAQHLKTAGFVELSALVMRNEKNERKGKPRAKRQTRVTVTDKYGRPARGGKGFVSQEVIERAMREEKDGRKNNSRD